MRRTTNPGQRLRKYWWAAYLFTLAITLIAGLYLSALPNKPNGGWLDRAPGLLAPGLLGSALFSALLLLSEYIRQGDDDEIHDEVIDGLDKMSNNVGTVAKELVGHTESLRGLGMEVSALVAEANVAKVGVTHAYAGRVIPHEKEYLDRYLNARRRIDMIGIDLSSVSRNFEYYTSSLRPGIPVRVLLADPDYPSTDSSYVRQRAREELQQPSAGNMAETYCRRYAVWERSLPEERRKQIDYKIRLCRALPALHYVRYDDEILFGPYLIEKSSEHTFTLVSGAGTPIFAQLSEHFERLWEKWSREPPREWFS